jgi:hypothetical protein
MKKINKGIELNFTQEEMKALEIALPLLEEISDIMNESDGSIFDETGNIVLSGLDMPCCLDEVKKALVGKSSVLIETDF